MGRLLFGLVFILSGVVLILNMLHITDISIGMFFAEFFWPLVLVAAGISFLFGGRRMSVGRLVIGLVLLGLGVIILGDHFGWFYLPVVDFWSFFWPVVLILLGVSLLSGSRRGDNRHWAVFGSVDKRNGTWQLRSGDYWAVMGGVNLDLRTAVIPEGRTVLNVTAFMGGINIIVPPDLAVVCRGTSVLGGFDFFGKENGGVVVRHEVEQGDVANADRVVYIDCQTVMGGVKVISRG